MVLAFNRRVVIYGLRIHPSNAIMQPYGALPSIIMAEIRRGGPQSLLRTLGPTSSVSMVPNLSRQRYRLRVATSLITQDRIAPEVLVLVKP